MGKNTIIVRMNAEKDRFNVNFPTLYEGENTFVVLNSKNRPVPDAEIFIGGDYYVSNESGNVTVTLPQGLETIHVEKPGFEPFTVKTDVNPIIYRYFPFLKRH